MKHFSIFIGAICLTILFTTTNLLAGEIHDAVVSGDLDKVRALLETDPGLLESKDENSNTPLLRACQSGKISVAIFLLDQGANVNATDNWNATPLIRSCQIPDQDVNLVQRLVDKGADVNHMGYNGNSPLHWAAYQGNLQVAEFLIDKGADVNIFDKYNGPVGSASISGTILQVAINFNSKEDMAKLLIESGAKIDQKDTNGNTELHLAALRGNADLAHYLIDHGANVHAVNEYNRTPLYYAAKHGYRGVAETLIAAGADTKSIVETNYGKAPQLTQTLQDGGAYLWFMGGGYVVKMKENLLVINSSNIAESLEAGLANGCLDPNELAGQKIIGLITLPERLWPYVPQVFELIKRIPEVDLVIYPKPAANNTNYQNIPSYRPVVPNESFSENGILVHTIPALAGGMGYLIEADGMKVFYGGSHTSNNEGSQRDKYRKEIDFLQPFGPIDIAILTVHSHSNTIGHADETHLYLLDQLSPKAVYLFGANIPEQYPKCAEVLRSRNIPVYYPEGGGIATGQRFHYLRD